jgi:hypothetical protein
MAVRDERWSEAIAVGSPPQFLLLTFLLFSRAGRLSYGHKVWAYTSVFAGKNNVPRLDNTILWEKNTEDTET